MSLMTRYRPTRTADVVLVSMPWAPPIEPALGLGILKACLLRASISARVFHAAPQLLRWCSLETYEFLASLWGINDFVFSGVLDEPTDGVQEERLHEIIELNVRTRRHPRYPDEQCMLDLLLKLRLEVMPKFISECVEYVSSCEPRLVGLTCLFDQTIASVAMAKKLKEVAPELPVVLGGYALEGAPGRTVAASFPWIDLIVSGDGERVIVDLAGDVAEGRPISDRATDSGRVIAAPKFDLAKSPTPDYADWFNDLTQLTKEHGVKVTTRVLPVESSRGCWWGQTQHCVFCGIDDETLKYRYKAAEHTLSMLTEMRELYGDYTFRFSDYIMPKSYYTELLPVLARQQPKFRLHSEIKANHPPERMRLLADAGFLEIQPGVESFSTPVLKEMHKGVRAIDNISLLKAGYLNRVTINYNILYGLPGDSPAAYLEMVERIPMLYHLAPPASRTETVVTRFAPLQSDPVRFGIRQAPTHHACYDVIFSKEYLEQSGFCLDSYAYYFERPFPYPPLLELRYLQLCQQVDHWKTLHRQGFVELSFEAMGDLVSVTDTRYSAEAIYCLSRAASAIYLECTDRPTNIARIQSALKMDDESVATEFSVALQELNERRLVWTEQRLILGLAAPKAVSDSHARDGWCQSWMQIYC
jgi:ribosomal peptide maturation radical SAM protein 1